MNSTQCDLLKAQSEVENLQRLLKEEKNKNTSLYAELAEMTLNSELGWQRWEMQRRLSNSLMEELENIRRLEQQASTVVSKLIDDYREAGRVQGIDNEPQCKALYIAFQQINAMQRK